MQLVFAKKTLPNFPQLKKKSFNRNVVKHLFLFDSTTKNKNSSNRTCNRYPRGEGKA